MQDLVSLLPILGIFLIFWLLVIRPASRRQRKLQDVQRALQVGDPVVTGSGVFGTVRGIEDDKVLLEVAEVVVLRVARQSVVGVVEDEKDQTTDDASQAPDSQAPDSQATDSHDAGAEAPRTHEEQ